ncbi:MAG: C1 family peptidase [Bryobacteraceae bacterium]
MKDKIIKIIASLKTFLGKLDKLLAKLETIIQVVEKDVERVYNLIPSTPDFRDYKFKDKLPLQDGVVLPTSFDLSKNMPPIVDQGNLGSCTANAGVACLEYLMIKDKKPLNILSRLFLYYFERVLDGDVSQDSGSSISNCMATILKYGVCLETLWPYNINKFAKKPGSNCVKEALTFLGLQYVSIDNTDINQIKQCIAINQFPIDIGISVYDSFESEQVAKTGIVPMPNPSENLLGGHSVVLVGFDDATKMFKVRNSWGNNWGIGGYFLIPYAYLTNTDLATDFKALVKADNA